MMKTTGEVAEETGISITTLYRYASQRPMKRAGRAYVWGEQDIAWAKAEFRRNDNRIRRLLPDAELFCALEAADQHKNFYAAGKATYLDRNSIRYRIKQLEKRYKKSLIVCGVFGVRLTADGKQLLADWQAGELPASSAPFAREEACQR